jgi:TRAP transporter TAXI family solute receptor
MKPKRLSALLGMFYLLLSLTLLPSAESREPFQIEIHSFMPGTTTYVMGVALADQINKHSTWLKATNVAGKGFLVSGKMLVVDPKTRKNTLHSWSTYTFYDFANGLLTGPLTGTKYDGARAVALGIGVTGNGFVTLNPNIKTLRDLAGKRVAGHVSKDVNLDFEAMLKAYGANIGLERLGYDEGKNALRDGKVDAALMPALWLGGTKWVPNPAFDELIKGGNVKWITWDVGKFYEGQKNLGKIPERLQQIPAPTTIPAGALTSDQGAWTVLPACLLWIADKEMPDDVVYEICRIYYEYAPAFHEYHMSARYISKETISKAMKREWAHPGAIKFYDKHGLKIEPVPGIEWASYPK